MPQLDKYTFIMQYFILYFFFILLFYFFYKYWLPIFLNILFYRNRIFKKLNYLSYKIKKSNFFIESVKNLSLYTNFLVFLLKKNFFFFSFSNIIFFYSNIRKYLIIFFFIF